MQQQLRWDVATFSLSLRFCIALHFEQNIIVSCGISESLVEDLLLPNYLWGLAFKAKKEPYPKTKIR